MSRPAKAWQAEDDAARIGFVKRHSNDNGKHRTAWEITCSRCFFTYKATWSPAIPADQLAKNVRVRGWDVGVGMRPLCPMCAHKKDKGPLAKPEEHSFQRFVPPEPDSSVYHALLTAVDKTTGRQALMSKLEKTTDKLLLAQETYEAAQAECEALKQAEKRARKEERQQRREARRAARLVEEAAEMERTAHALEEKNEMANPSLKITHTVFQLLDSVFDPIKRLYRPPYSDARVAKDCGTTEEVVRGLRAEVYGELAEDPRIQNVMDDIALAEMQFAEFVKNSERIFSDLKSRVDQLRANVGK